MRAPYRVVVITGASSGLGAALASAYAGPGVAMGLIGRHPERLAAAPPPAAPRAPLSTARRSMSLMGRPSAPGSKLSTAHILSSC
jgi:NAD(P)-dependent dehydrogenase (short-subunit alcohol dehydrogenase family)